VATGALCTCAELQRVSALHAVFAADSENLSKADSCSGRKVCSIALLVCVPIKALFIYQWTTSVWASCIAQESRVFWIVVMPRRCLLHNPSVHLEIIPFESSLLEALGGHLSQTCTVLKPWALALLLRFGCCDCLYLQAGIDCGEPSHRPSVHLNCRLQHWCSGAHRLGAGSEFVTTDKTTT
jgi:hypothetical protein